MAVVLLSNLAPITEPDAVFFTDLIHSFETLGHEVVFWSTEGHPSLDHVRLPSAWALKDWLTLFPVDHLLPPDSGDIDAEKWSERIAVLGQQEIEPEARPALLEIAMRVSRHILETVRPDLYLAWTPTCPHTGILADLCRRAHIPVLALGPGPLPQTWVLDNGLGGQSQLVGAQLEALESNAVQRYRDRKAGQAAARFLANHPSSTPQIDLQEALLALGGQPRVLVLATDDSLSGVFPQHGADRGSLLPGYGSSLEAVQAVAEQVAAIGGITLFRPESQSDQLSYDLSGSPTLHHSSAELGSLIAWADVVVSTGSLAAHQALALGKPVVLLARDMMAGKGCAYEALQPADLSAALRAAVQKEGWKAKQAAFCRYLGWLVRRYLLHPSSMAQSYETWSVAQAIDKIHQRALALRPAWSHSGELIAACLEARPARSVGQEFGLLPNGAMVADDLASFEQQLCQRETTLAVVGFDHVLFAGNATELYLDSIRPRWLAAVVHAIITGLEPWRWLAKKGQDPLAYRDYVRVLWMTLFFPWSPLVWAIKARTLAKDLAVAPVVQALRRIESAPVHILSRGFRFIISPLVRALGLPGALITAEPFWGGPDIRLYGKRQVLREAHGGETLSQAIALVGRPEDADVLSMVRQGWFIRWPHKAMTAFSDAYVPLRYAAEGRSATHPLGRAVRQQHVGEDLMVALLAYALSPAFLTVTAVPSGGLWLAICAVLLLFLSFFAVYEIGYHEHDFLAADPRNSSARHASPFARYPIGRGGWGWGIGAGVLGCAFASGALAVRAAPESKIGLAILALFVGWFLLLGGTRFLFSAFNRANARRQASMFPILQCAKTAGPAIALGMSGAGLALITAQIFSRVAGYLAMRAQGGGSEPIDRQAYRMIFVLLVLAGLTALSPALVGWGQPQVWLVLAWVFYRALQKRRPQEG